MGLVATLRHSLKCERCKQFDTVDSQFRLGAMGEMPIYRIGERVEWDAPRERRFGSPDDGADCVCVGYPNLCDACGAARLVSVVVRSNRFVEARFRHGYAWEPEEILRGPERRGIGEIVRGEPWKLTRESPEGLRCEWAGDRLVRVDGRTVRTLVDHLDGRDPERILALEVFWGLWSEGYFEIEADRDEDGRVLVTLTNSERTDGVPEPLRPYATALEQNVPWGTRMLPELLVRASRGPLLWALSNLHEDPEARSLVARAFELLRRDAHPTAAANKETLHTLRYAIELPLVM